MARIQKQNNLGRNVALGLSGIAITTGAVVVGRALARDENRKALRKNVRKAAGKIKEIQKALEEGRARYQAIAHSIKNPRKRGTKFRNKN